MASSYLASAEEDLTCPLCFEIFADPHTPIDLSCPHVFCCKCLNQLIQGGIISCPECRQKTTVPKGGVNSLKINRRIRNLAEKYNEFSEKERMRETIGFCSNHKDEKLAYYCITCDVFTCKSCSEHKTKSHDCQDIETAQHKLRKNLRRALAESKQIVEKKEALIQDLLVDENNFRANVDQEVQKLNKATAEVLKTSEALKTQLEEAGSVQLKPCLALQIKHKEQIGNIQKAMEEAHHAMGTGTVSELIENQARLEALLKSKDAECGKRETRLGKVRFLKSDKKLDLGRVVTCNQAGIQIEKIQQLKQPKNMNIIAAGKDGELLQEPESLNIIAAGIDGVVLLGGWFNKYVYIYTKHKNEKYHKNKMLLLKPGPLKSGLVPFGACDMAMSVDGKYIIARDGYVEIYSTELIIERIMYTSPTMDMEHLVGICVTLLPNGNIVLGDYGQCTLIVHNPQGDRQKYISIEVHPQFLTAVNDRTVATADGCKHRIYLINLQNGAKMMSIKSSGPSSGTFCYYELTNSLLVHNLQYCCTTGKLISEIHLPGDIRLITSIPVPNQEYSILAAVDGDGITFYKASPDYKNTLYTGKSIDLYSIHKNLPDQEDGTEKKDQEVRCSYSKCLIPETDVLGGLKRCTRCKSALYCSKECQAKHWKMHRLTCSNSH